MTQDVLPTDDGASSAIKIIISFDPETSHISVAVPSTMDPLLTFQVLNQVTAAQIPAFCQEVLRLREEVAVHRNGGGIVTAAAIPQGIVGPMDAPTNLREFRRGK